ncbi:MAG: GNAT family N-acetyltransferase [Nitrospirota bacterium]
MNIVGEIRCYLGDDYALLKFSESKTSFSIDIVTVPALYRGQGIGTMLINHILLLADHTGKDTRVTVRPIGSAGEEKLQRLIRYYRKFGFEILEPALPQHIC